MKPRILFITPLPPPVHGSAMVSQYIKDCKELQEEFECDFVNLSTSRNIDEIGKKSLMKYIRFIGAYFITFWKLLTHRYALCYLAITCHGMGFLKDAPFVLLCKLFRRRVVIHQHNKGMSNSVDKQPYKWLMPLVYRNTKVILLSWYLYPDIEKVVKKEQILICPNGIPELFDKEPHFERKNQVPNLLFLSNLIPSKGVYVLLDACKILKEKGYKFVCNFVGGESKEITKEVFEKAVDERGLNEIVYYKGPKYGDEKNEFFANSDIFVQPTLNDCFPLTLLEAMQYKLPIITTNEGAIEDIVTPLVNGIITISRTPEELSNNIALLLKEECQRRIFGENGYKIFKEKFTQEQFEENILKLLINVNGGVKFVNYLGPKYGDEKNFFFSNADIFVFPTYYFNECFPLVLLEAMQYKLPIITSCEGGIPDIVTNGENGFVCKTNDVDTTADAIEKLLKDSGLRTQMGNNGHKIFKNKFTLEVFNNNIAMILKELAS